MRERRWEDARSHLTRVIEQCPDLAEAHYYLGVSQRHCGALEDATDSFLLAAAHRDGFVEALHALGEIYLERECPDEAEDYLRQALAIAPDDVKIINQLGCTFLARPDYPSAIAQFRRAHELAPALAAPMSNLALALGHAGVELAEALPLAEEAVRISPGSAEFHCNLGTVLHVLGEDERALGAFDAALRISPAYARAAVNRALLHLAHGRLREGWSGYEARRLVDRALRHAAEVYPYPEWSGENLAGRTILVYGEQGLGDEIMFASCMNDLVRGARCVIVECAVRASRLFARSFPDALVVGRDQLGRDRAWLKKRGLVPDCKVAIGSLPRWFRTTPDAWPVDRGYLRADPRRREYWTSRLGALTPGLRIGLSWRGGTAKTGAQQRSTQLEDWLPLFTAGNAVVSLQYGGVAGEVERLRERTGAVLHVFPEALRDLDETAALVCATDLVISIDNTAALLAGALGHAGFVALPAHPEWRYPREGSRWPWFPSLRLVRQQARAQWHPVVEEIASALCAGAHPASGAA